MALPMMPEIHFYPIYSTTTKVETVGIDPLTNTPIDIPAGMPLTSPIPIARGYYMKLPYVPDIPSIIKKPENRLFREYYLSIHTELLTFFSEMTRILQAINYTMISVGGFAKNLYSSPGMGEYIDYEDFDFQIFINSIDGKYLDDYKSSITEDSLERVKFNIASLLTSFTARMNSMTRRRFPEFTLESGIPPGPHKVPPPVKLIIRYKTSTAERVLKVADFNFNRHSVFAYNEIGSSILRHYDGEMPVVDIIIETAGISGLIKTLRSCAFYIEKSFLDTPDVVDIDKGKIRRDMEYWTPKCDQFAKMGVDIGRPDTTAGARTRASRPRAKLNKHSIYKPAHHTTKRLKKHHKRPKTVKHRK
jgi:hypothetical protein